MAKGRIPATGSQKTLDDILEVLQGVEQDQLVESVKKLVQLANRPVIAGMVLYDPVLNNVSLQGLANFGQVPVELLEKAFNEAIDRLKVYKAEQALKQAQQQQPPPQETKETSEPQ